MNRSIGKDDGGGGGGWLVEGRWAPAMIQSRFYYFCIRDASVIASLCKSSGFCLVLFERPAKVRRFVRRRPFRCGMNEMAAFFLFRLQQQQEIIENKKTRDSVSDSMASDSMLFHFSIQKKKDTTLSRHITCWF